MTVFCGKCGSVVFVSNNRDWKTNKEKPEISCENCEEIHFK